MKIQDMFLKDINRDIRGVVKVQQMDEENIYQELDEYVVTKELKKHFATFYQNYANSIDQPTDKVGVWISGFFGSGKSHFLKILSYLLGNQPVHGKEPVDFFKDKISDSLVLGLMEKSANVETETILFNIDAKSQSNYTSRDAILRVFKKVFDDHRGYYGDHSAISSMEIFLDKEGKFESFKEKYQTLVDEPWVGNQNNFHFRREEITQALSQVLALSEEDAKNWFDNINQSDNLTIEAFAQEVKEYVDHKGKHFRLVFLVDEIGQYIGDDRNLMLNLQTVVENLGSTSLGKVWVLVTSQESIDDIVKVKGDDFSRIQGRFDTRLSLSSSSADEVIKKRILDKNPSAHASLKASYPKRGPILNNLISFKDTPGIYQGYNDGEEFAQDYPFVPYQFKLLQNIFEQIRKHGSSGKHLSEGERSLLSAYQEAAQQYKNEEEGILIPLYAFYNTMSEFLNPSITRVINGAEHNQNLADQKLNIDLLKVLFMIKYIDEIPGNIDNIATLMVTDINEDKSTLKSELKASLNKLKQERLIQKNGEEFIFLTDEEQDVNREIQNMSVDERLIIEGLSEYLFEEIYPDKKYQYSDHYQFGFNKKFDTVNHGNQTAGITLHVISPLSNNDGYEEDLRMKTLDGKDMIIYLGAEATYIEEMEEVLKIEQYRNSINHNNLSMTKQHILDNKVVEARERRNRVRNLLEASVKEADFYSHGEKLLTKGSTAREHINAGLAYLVENTYTKLKLVKAHVHSDKELRQKIKSSDSDTLSLELDDSTLPNKLAMEEIVTYIDLQNQRNTQMTVKTIIEQFKTIPFGWTSLDIASMLVDLLKDEKIRIQYNSMYLTVEEHESQLMTVLTNNSEIGNGVVYKRERIAPTLIRDVKGIVRELFETINLPQDEDGLMREIQGQIDDQKDEIRNYKQYYMNKDYPGQSLLDKGLEIYDKFSTRMGPLTYFNTLVELEDDLLQWHEDYDNVQGFFNSNQRELFDQGLEIIDKYEQNREFFESESNESIDNSVFKLKEIIKNPEPYSQIKDIPLLASEFNETFNVILEETRTKVKDSLNNDYEEMKKYSDQTGVSDRTKANIDTAWDGLTARVDDTTDIQRVDNLITYSGREKEKIEKIINREIEEARKVTEQDDRDVINDEKPVRKVRLTQLTTPNRLKTEQDVDIYLNKLAKRLKKEVQLNIIDIVD